MHKITMVAPPCD